MAYNDNRFLYWVISGIAGVLTRDIYSFISKMLGFAKFYVWDIGADVFIEGPLVHTIGGTVVGFMTDFVTGGLLGVITGFLIDRTGTRQYLLKGLGMGLIAWLFLFGILFHTLPQTQALAPKDPMSSISAFIGHSIFGLAVAFTYVKLAKLDTKSWQRRN